MHGLGDGFYNESLHCGNSDLQFVVYNLKDDSAADAYTAPEYPIECKFKDGLTKNLIHTSEILNSMNEFHTSCNCGSKVCTNPTWTVTLTSSQNIYARAGAVVKQNNVLVGVILQELTGTTTTFLIRTITWQDQIEHPPATLVTNKNFEFSIYDISNIQSVNKNQPGTGMYCRPDNTCSWSTVCSSTPSELNTETCLCGSNQCQANQYCLANYTCSNSAPVIPNCQFTLGVEVNGGTCMCGTTQCDSTVGLVCNYQPVDPGDPGDPGDNYQPVEPGDPDPGDNYQSVDPGDPVDNYQPVDPGDPCVNFNENDCISENACTWHVDHCNSGPLPQRRLLRTLTKTREKVLRRKLTGVCSGSSSGSGSTPDCEYPNFNGENTNLPCMCGIETCAIGNGWCKSSTSTCQATDPGPPGGDMSGEQNDMAPDSDIAPGGNRRLRAIRRHLSSVKGLGRCRCGSLCNENEHVENNNCVACPPGTINLAGDSPGGSDTACWDKTEIKNQYNIRECGCTSSVICTFLSNSYQNLNQC